MRLECRVAGIVSASISGTWKALHNVGSTLLQGDNIQHCDNFFAVLNPVSINSHPNAIHFKSVQFNLFQQE